MRPFGGSEIDPLGEAQSFADFGIHFTGYDTPVVIAASAKGRECGIAGVRLIDRRRYSLHVGPPLCMRGRCNGRWLGSSFHYS